jgi:hypothetical protein
VQQIARRYRAGPAAIGDRRHANPGAALLLTREQQEQVRQALAGPALDGGAWSCRSVATWMSQPDARPARQRAALLGVDAPPRLHPASAASPGHLCGSRRARGALKKGLAEQVVAVRRVHPEATVSFWAEDDHRLGLPPVVRRVWAPCGQRPIAHVQRRFQRHYTWLDVYGFVRPSTGQSWWCLLPTVTVPSMSPALAAFSR